MNCFIESMLFPKNLPINTSPVLCIIAAEIKDKYTI